MYDLIWMEHAWHDLPGVWAVADLALRPRIEAALLELEEAIRRDPHGTGESREFSRRIAFAAPLMITFHADDPARLVRVHHVRLYGR